MSSGAGILDWKSRRLLRRHGFETAGAERVVEVLNRLGVDFMAHAPVPDDHCFRFVRARPANPDFDRRIGRYGEFAAPWDSGGPGDDSGGRLAITPETCQFVAILGRDEADLLERVRVALPGFAVVRSTSPLDGCSIWVEVRPPGVGKSAAVAWLAARHRLDAGRTAAVGNDYNDTDMLGWSGNAFVVRKRCPGVARAVPRGLVERCWRVQRGDGGCKPQRGRIRPRRSPGRELVHRVAKGLAGFEGRNSRGGNDDAFTGTGIAPLTG